MELLMQRSRLHTNRRCMPWKMDMGNVAMLGQWNA